MGKKIIKDYNRIIAFLLSLLGIGSYATFTACGPIGGCEYGTPHADFKINGSVINEQNKSVPGVKVKMLYDSTYTNAQGKYQITVEDFPTSQTFSISFIDIDSIENGNMQQLDSTVVFTDPEFKNGGGDWYEGETSQEFNVTMKESE